MLRAVFLIAAIGLVAGCQSWQSRAPFANKLSMDEGTGTAEATQAISTASARCAIRGEERDCLPQEF